MSTAAPAQQASQQKSGYEVSRPHGKCAKCESVIEAGSKLMALLRETPAGFERLDICLSCWPNVDRGDALGFWQTVMPKAEQKKKIFVDDEVLCGLFERLAGATEPAKINFRFVLGLILMRKRMIVYEGSRRDGETEFWVVRFRGREDKLDLLNPRLDESQVMDVSKQLGEILNEEI